MIQRLLGFATVLRALLRALGAATWLRVETAHTFTSVQGGKVEVSWNQDLPAGLGTKSVSRGVQARRDQ